MALLQTLITRVHSHFVAVVGGVVVGAIVDVCVVDDVNVVVIVVVVVVRRQSPVGTKGNRRLNFA